MSLRYPVLDIVSQRSKPLLRRIDAGILAPRLTTGASVRIEIVQRNGGESQQHNLPSFNSQDEVLSTLARACSLRYRRVVPEAQRRCGCL